MTFVRIWRFTVKPEHDAEFREMNGPDGAWARLFARAEGYLGSTLEPDTSRAHSYRTQDVWRSAGDFRAFLAAHADEYRSLDERAADWTLEETLEFEGLSVAGHRGHDDGLRGPAAGREEETP